MAQDAVLDVEEKPGLGQWIGLDMQHVFSMFGSTVLVPILVGLDPSIVLFSSSVGTLFHLLITHHKIPAYIGSSFIFIAPVIALMKTAGCPAIAQGVIASGLVCLIVALIVALAGSDWIDRIPPPIVVGPIVMVVGLSLAGTTTTDTTMGNSKYDLRYFAVAMLTLLVTIVLNMYFKGFWGLIPILLGIISGYIIARLFGIVDFSRVMNVSWISMPEFEIPFVSYSPKMYWGAILSMAPIALVAMTEHMGRTMVLNELTGRDFFKDPGLKRTLAGDGVASVAAGLLGGPSVTSYGENTGVTAITRVHNVYVLTGVTVFAILFSFVGKLNALIESIPSPAIGGISFLLFGVIAASGLKIIVEKKIDLNKKRNLVIAPVILTIGIGNAYLQLGNFQFFGVAVATILGIILSLVLPQEATGEKE